MNDEEYVSYYFESQRPMTKEEEYEYYQIQMEKYWSMFVPMLPVIDMRKTLARMIVKSGKQEGQ